ncbi:MAG: PLP-dependent cysteine synthase family protein [Haloglomus sp.]
MKPGILETLGSPLVQVQSPPGSVIAAKVESKNPGGSAKDRPAVAMVEAAERDGHLEPGDRIVEPTSGNTGIGIALVAAAKGYDATLVMPESKSPERRALMKAYGADIELVSGDISAAKDRADEIEQEAGAVQLRQFENPANPESHYRTTGPEILEQVDDAEVDALVAGIGTGGTITGIGRRLREEFPEMEIVGVEPESNAVLSGGEPADDDFQGMGPGFVSPNLDRNLLDHVETVDIESAEAEVRRLAREEGILVGQSSAASNLAAKRVARRFAEERGTTDTDTDCPAPSNETHLFDDAMSARSGTESGSGTVTVPDDCPLVVTVFWDSGERYVSTGLFDRGD